MNHEFICDLKSGNKAYKTEDQGESIYVVLVAGCQWDLPDQEEMREIDNRKAEKKVRG